MSITRTKIANFFSCVMRNSTSDFAKVYFRQIRHNLHFEVESLIKLGILPRLYTQTVKHRCPNGEV